MTAPVYSAITAAGRISELKRKLERAVTWAVALEQENADLQTQVARLRQMSWAALNREGGPL